MACKFGKPMVSGAAFSGNIQISLGKLPLSVVIGCFQRDIEYMGKSSTADKQYAEIIFGYGNGLSSH